MRIISRGVVVLLVWILAAMSLAAVNKQITVSLVGDCLITQRISHLTDPAFLKLIGTMRQADGSFGNCETALFDPSKGFPAYKDVDPNIYCLPWGADELKWTGLDIMSTANNHVLDFDIPGMLATLQNLDRVGIRHAGAGVDLEAASRHGRFDTRSGIVSLVSCVSWLPEKNFQASARGSGMKGRPGTNPVNLDEAVQVDAATFERLKAANTKILESLGLPPEEPAGGQGQTQPLLLGETSFAQGDSFGLRRTPRSADVDRVLSEIRLARRTSRIVMVALHEHIGANNNDAPSPYEEQFARACIDAGADIFVGTGSHELWGIEIYKGRPIFYSLGNFLFQLQRGAYAPEAYDRLGLPSDKRNPSSLEQNLVEYFKDDKYWESFMPVVKFTADNKVEKIIIYPYVLLHDRPGSVFGYPRMAEGESRKAILDRLARLSQPYHTELTTNEDAARVILAN